MISNSDLALSGLTKTYDDFSAVDNVTMRIKQGELVAFLGPSGCGKTTTLRMIAGLAEPTSGEILIGGTRVTHVPPQRRNIGMLFQNYALFPHMSVADNVGFGLRMRKISRAERDQKVRAALDLVQLSHLADRYPRSLSGGQQQRIALARAIVIEPALLLLDEPLGALDKNLREAMQIELRQIQRRLGITTVLVTHDQDEAMTMADQIAIMSKGRIEQMGTPSEIYSSPSTRFVAGFIGVSNFITGTPSGSACDKHALTLDGGGQAIVRGPIAGGNVQLTVRPEAVEVRQWCADDAADQETNWTRAVVDDVIYRGSATHVLMTRGNGAPFVAFIPNKGGATSLVGVSKGDTVLATWQEGANHRLPA